MLVVIERPLPGFHRCGRISICVRCTLGPVIGAANFAVLERPDLADPGFSRVSAVWRSNSNDGNLAG